jgi:hypothetical protein
MRRIPIVLFAEHPPADQGNAQRAKVLLTRNAIKRVSGLGRILSYPIPLIGIRGRLLTIQYEECSICEIVTVRDRKGSSQTRAFNPWKGAEAGHYIVHLTELPSDCCRFCTLWCLRHWTRKLDGDEVLWSKSGIRGSQPQETPAKEPCSDQNHKRRGDFADYQNAARPLANA